MGGNQPNDHDLNWMLARVCGIKLNNMDTWWQLQHSTHGMEWNPLHDANQMERVKAKLRERDMEYSIEYEEARYTVFLFELKPFKPYNADSEESELRAFALAVAAWWNEQKKEKAT